MPIHYIDIYNYGVDDNTSNFTDDKISIFITEDTIPQLSITEDDWQSKISIYYHMPKRHSSKFFQRWQVINLGDQA